MLGAAILVPVLLIAITMLVPSSRVSLSLLALALIFATAALALWLARGGLYSITRYFDRQYLRKGAL